MLHIFTHTWMQTEVLTTCVAAPLSSSIFRGSLFGSLRFDICVRCFAWFRNRVIKPLRIRTPFCKLRTKKQSKLPTLRNDNIIITEDFWISVYPFADVASSACLWLQQFEVRNQCFWSCSCMHIWTHARNIIGRTHWLLGEKVLVHACARVTLPTSSRAW